MLNRSRDRYAPPVLMCAGVRRVTSRLMIAARNLRFSVAWPRSACDRCAGNGGARPVLPRITAPSADSEMTHGHFDVRSEQMKVTAPHFFLILRTVAPDRGSLLSVAESLSLSSRREASDARSLLSESRSRESDWGAHKSETNRGAGAMADRRWPQRCRRRGNGRPRIEHGTPFAPPLAEESL